MDTVPACLLQQCDSRLGPALQWGSVPAPCLATCPRIQCLGSCGDGFLALPAVSTLAPLAMLAVLSVEQVTQSLSQLPVRPMCSDTASSTLLCRNSMPSQGAISSLPFFASHSELQCLGPCGCGSLNHVGSALSRAGHSFC